MMALLVFGEYGSQSGYDPMGKTARILYGTFARPLWVVSVGFVIYSCVTSYGGFVNQILTWSLWLPLSKLSFCAYLVNFMVLDVYLYNQEQTPHVEAINFVSLIFRKSKCSIKFFLFVCFFDNNKDLRFAW